MFKSILFAILLASCASKETFPTHSQDEQKWLQEYRDGDISWEQYQERLKNEKKP